MYGLSKITELFIIVHVKECLIVTTPLRFSIFFLSYNLAGELKLML